MKPLILISTLLATTSPLRFERHDIDAFPAGYQVAVAEVNGDANPDVIALSIENDRVDWYRNPGWDRQPVVRTARNIDLAPFDLDGDGRVELALASGFYFSDSSRGGEIALLSQPAEPGTLWNTHPVAVDPVVHRLRWGDLDGDGRPELIHAPIFGPGSKGAEAPTPAHLWAFRVPQGRRTDAWEVWKIDETLTVLHGIFLTDLDQDRRDEILTASFEGIHLLNWKGPGPDAWKKTLISSGMEPQNQLPRAACGSSEIGAGKFADGSLFLASIEPWHGHQLVVYTPTAGLSQWRRHVVDDSLVEGHALVLGDFDGDGGDEIAAGWRGGPGGIALYDTVGSRLERFTRQEIDREIAVEGMVLSDLNGDGRPDLVAIAGRTNHLVWYDNRND